MVLYRDWFSRYVLSYAFSITMDTDFCLKALRDGLNVATPEIFNSDQGPLLTSDAFTRILKKAGISISMDSRGRALGNVFVERLWHTVKSERVPLHSCKTVREAEQDIPNYFDFYNKERTHTSLGYQNPAEVYFNCLLQQSYTNQGR